MRRAFVIDTNVGIVSNGRHERASPMCVSTCIQALRDARRGVVLLDDGLRILDEYRGYLSASGQPGVGDAFFKWLWSNQGNRRYCQQIAITAIGDSGIEFAEFPNDPRLSRFDPNDRKFVAVALASGMDPAILNATDSDWWNFREPLEGNGVRISFLCPELMERE